MVPLDIAQYAEGQRFVAFFVLDQVLDSGKDGTGKNVEQFLCAMTEPRDGLPYDFDQVRVYTWNVRRRASLRNCLPRARPQWRASDDRDQREFR